MSKEKTNDPKNCLECKKIFYRKINISYKNWEKTKYCSKKCFTLAGRIKTKCTTCKNQFYVRKSFENKIICCSEKCRKLRRAKTCKERLLPNKRGDWTKEKNPRWKPLWTKKDDGHGYVLIKIKEESSFKNWKQEHVYVMEQSLGREINLNKECVHHIDADKKNNKIENLCLMTHSDHRSLHMNLPLKELIKKKYIKFDYDKKLYIIL